MSREDAEIIIPDEEVQQFVESLDPVLVQFQTNMQLIQKYAKVLNRDHSVTLKTIADELYKVLADTPCVCFFCCKDVGNQVCCKGYACDSCISKLKEPVCPFCKQTEKISSYMKTNNIQCIGLPNNNEVDELSSQAIREVQIELEDEEDRDGDEEFKGPEIEIEEEMEEEKQEQKEQKEDPDYEVEEKKEEEDEEKKEQEKREKKKKDFIKIKEEVSRELVFCDFQATTYGNVGIRGLLRGLNETVTKSLALNTFDMNAKDLNQSQCEQEIELISEFNTRKHKVTLAFRFRLGELIIRLKDIFNNSERFEYGGRVYGSFDKYMNDSYKINKSDISYLRKFNEIVRIFPPIIHIGKPWAWIKQHISRDILFRCVNEYIRERRQRQ